MSEIIFPDQITNWTPASNDRVLFSDTSDSWTTKDCAISEMFSAIWAWQVNAVVWWTNISVDDSDPINPIINLDITEDVDLWTHNIKWNSYKFVINPTEPTDVWATFYDDTHKTLATVIDAHVTLQHWQEMMHYCYNWTWSLISNWKLVYQSWVQNSWWHSFHSIALAKADAVITSNVLWMATEDIADGQFWWVTTRWVVHDIDTSLYSPATILYLSDTVAWWFTATSPARSIIIGTVLGSNATTGSVDIDIWMGQSLSSLTDTTILTPSVWQSIVWNWTSWVNASTTVASVWPWVNFYNDDTSILWATTNNVNKVDTLLRSPNTSISEVVDAYNCTNNTIFWEAYLDWVLWRTLIDAWTWTFNTWCSVSSTAWWRISSLTRNLNQVILWAWTLTTTWTWTTRTATITWWTPFVSWDVNADITLCNWLQTPQWLYRITAFTSSSVVSIETPTTYANESWVSYSKWKRLFWVNTWAITFVWTSYWLVTTSTAQPSYSINSTDKIGSIVFATSNNTTTVNFLHNWNARYSYFSSPLITSHQDLALLQWWSSNERYHLTQSQATEATQTANWTRNWLLSSSDYTAFNSIVSNAVQSIAWTPTWWDRVSNIISLTTAEYTSASKDSATMYLITDA